MTRHMKQEPKPQPRRRRWVVPVALAGTLAGAYLAGVAAFSFVYLPGTTLDGADVSLRAVTDVAAEKSGTFDGYSVHLTGDGVDLEIDASQIGLACDGETYARSAHDQTSPWAWPVEALRQRSLTADEGADYDKALLDALLQPAIDEAGAVAAELGGTGISYDAAQGAFVLDPRVVPAHLDLARVHEALERAFSAREREVVLDETCLQGGTPLQAPVDQANAMLGATVDLTLGGTHVADADAATIAGWVRIGEDLSVGLDRRAVEDYCRGPLSQTCDSAGTTRSYTLPDGTTRTVDDGDRSYGRSAYGWVIDGGRTADALCSAIESGQPSTLEVVCLQTAARFNPGGQDWGDRFVDVDLTAQHARFYEGGNVIWEADITSGQPNQGHATPTGVWAITNRKDGDINLKGPVDPETGEPEWDSHVQFWMGVVRNVIGFHNAPWQHRFGGDIYTYYGSHGCIRLDYEPARQLFELVRVGDPVVIHK